MHGEAVLGGLVALSLFKKLTAYGIARYYGFPKIYRKLVRANRRLTSTSEDAARFNQTIKSMFRFPNRLAARLSTLSRSFRATTTRPSTQDASNKHL